MSDIFLIRISQKIRLTRQMVPLNILHVIGVAFGAGGATGLDLFLINLTAKNACFKAHQSRLVKNLSRFSVANIIPSLSQILKLG